MGHRLEGAKIPQNAPAPPPLPKAERVSVGNRPPGDRPRTAPQTDLWTDVVNELQPSENADWTLVAKVATETQANQVIDRLGQHRDIQGTIRIEGPGDIRVYARKVPNSGPWEG